MISFDVLIASYNRPKYLRFCVDSVINGAPQGLGQINILILDTDIKSHAYLAQLNTSLFKINILRTKDKLTPGASRNLLIRSSNADYLCFLDDDITVSEKYFEKAKRQIQETDCDIFGGPDRSFNEESDISQKVIGEILSNFFVMGPTYIRHTQKKLSPSEVDETSLTLCNLWIKKSVLSEKNQNFDEDLRRCEENDLLIKLKKDRRKFSYNSSMYVYHYRRTKVFDIARIQFFSGYYRGVVLLKNIRSKPYFFLIPFFTGAFTFYSLFFPNKLFIFLLLFHFILNLSVSFNVWKKFKESSFIQSFKYILTIHLFFSLGIFLSIFSIFRRVNARS